MRDTKVRTGGRRAGVFVSALVLALALAPSGVAGAITAPPEPPVRAAWVAMGALNQARSGHTATLLPDGRVLVTGGNTAFGATSRTELFDPARNSWSYGGPLDRARMGHTATLLPRGQVMVVGGRGLDGVPITSVEVYDPGVDKWFMAQSLLVPRANHTATVLADDSLLVAGGETVSGPTPLVERHIDGAWQTSNPMGTARSHHAAALLADGTVLVAGGRGLLGVERSAERFDGAGNWVPTGTMDRARVGHTASVLDGSACELTAPQPPPAYCGDVLVVGGADATGIVAATEAYDAALGSWTSLAKPREPRRDHTATVLGNGQVLVAGGIGFAGAALTSSELYDPGTDTWTATAPMITARSEHTATMLGDGTVLAAGGRGAFGPLARSEAYRPAGGLSVSNIAPSGGPVAGATVVTINGTGFAGARGVSFGDAAASSFEVVDDTTIVAVSPPHAAGPATVIVTNTTASSTAYVSSAFVYYDVPGTVSGLTADPLSARTIRLTIPAAADGSGTLWRATRYVVKQSTVKITAATFDAATSLCGGECDFGQQASQYTLDVTDLLPSTTYYYAVKAVSPGGTGAMSNVAKARTRHF